LSFHFISDPEPDILRKKIPDSTFSHSILQKLSNLSGETLPTADQIDHFHNFLHKLSNLSGEALPAADQIDLFHNFLNKLSLLVISLPLAVHLDV